MREYIWTPAPAASRNSEPKRNRRAWSPDWWCPSTIEPPAPRPPTIMSAALHGCAFGVMTSRRPLRGSPAAQAGAPRARTSPAARRAVARGRNVLGAGLPGGGRVLGRPAEALGASHMPHLQASFFSKRDAPRDRTPKTQPRRQLDLALRPLRHFRRAPPTPPPPLVAGPGPARRATTPPPRPGAPSAPPRAGNPRGRRVRPPASPPSW